MKIQKWGNSLGVRIPGPFAEQLNIHDGTEIELILKESEIVIRPTHAKPNLKDLLSRITPENRHQEIDIGKPEGNEAW